MNIVIIEGHQTLPHTISLLKAITDSHYTLRTRGRNPSPLTDHFMRKKKNPVTLCASVRSFLPLPCHSKPSVAFIYEINEYIWDHVNIMASAWSYIPSSHTIYKFRLYVYKFKSRCAVLLLLFLLLVLKISIKLHIYLLIYNLNSWVIKTTVHLYCLIY